MKLLKFGTLNTRGIKKERHNDGSLSLNLINILSDINKNNIDALGIQESHLGEHEYLQKEQGYVCYFVNEKDSRHHGSGIIVRDIYNPIFKRISPRICTASFKIANNQYLFVSGYAPHETLSINCPDLRETFYDDLQKALLQRNANTITILSLDANAQTCYIPEFHPSVLGHFTKGDKINTNGQRLINFATENDLFLTNTRFQHKMSHRSTWTAPYRPLQMADGQIRKHPIRTQIDYVLISQKHLQFVTDSRSYNNIQTETDHNLVIMNLKLELSKLNRPKNSTSPNVNIDNFQNPEYVLKYQQKITDTAELNKENIDNTARWSNIVDICLKTGEEVLGPKPKNKKSKESQEIKILSDTKQRLHKKINECNSQAVKSKLKEESKNIKKDISVKLKEIEETELDKKMEKLENIKDDNTKYFYVLREMHNNNNNKKASVIVKDEDDNVPGSTNEKIKIIERYFKKTLAPDDMNNEFLTVPPCKMKEKFTPEEVQKIAKRLNNNKASGPDRLQAEYIKYAPLAIFEQIADILNNTAETGDVPLALVHGLLFPIQKPGKQKGPPENLRPIILLSILRKILTISLLDRTWDRLATRIPKSQAAYQRGRGTTEQVLALKLLIDKAITSSDYDVFILLLDMSKAFDTVNRKVLLQELGKVLQPDELHLLSILTNRPLLSIHLDGETGEGFETNVGICQGDCLSAVLFIYYLACALEENPAENVPRDLKAFLDIFYADDLTYATTSNDHRTSIKNETPKKLKKYNLHVNNTKTEEGEAPDRRPPPPPPPPPLEDPQDIISWGFLDWLIPRKMFPPEPT